MKATELRIGNWVSDEYADGSRYKTKVNIEQIEYPHNCQPIPLTEDILLKCGFRVTTFDGLPWYEKECLTLDFMFDFERHDASTNRVHHVHQLQNLYFALTSEELNVEL
jgi:hypothetical protein